MTSTSDPLVGHVLDGRYRIIDRVARGGMATVYRATDTRLDRMVAVKVMHVGLGDDADFTRKFDREARAAARLSHPNVVSVFDQGTDADGSGGSGRPYIVMELVEGRTLRSVISHEAPLTPVRALSMIEPVLSALAAAHDAGLVHRDIKPENVLISERGQIKVGDFGLARAVTAQTSTATAGLLIGTVSYLPPELVVSGKADARSDVYSTGVVLFEMLTGRKPHTGETPIQVAYAHVHADVPPPSSLPTAGPIPDYVDALIARATARNADARPHDARVMLAQVRRVKSALQAGLQTDPELSQDLTVPLIALREATRRGAGYSPDSPGSSDDRADRDAEVDPYARTTALGSAVELAAAEERAGALRPGPPPAGAIPAPVIPAPTTSRPGTSVPSASARAASVRAAYEDREYTPTDIRFLSRPSTPVHLSSPSASPYEVDAEYDDTSDYDDGPAPAADVRPVPPHRPVHRSRHRARGWVALILVLLLTLGAAAAGWYYAKGRFTTTPALTSLTKQQAENVADESGLEITFSQSYSETVPKGSVIDTRPRPGAKILRGGEVDAVLSRGPERYPMPKVVGLSRGAAVAALSKGHLAVGDVTDKYSETVDKGLVISSSATAGDQLKPDTKIDLVVSAGRRPITIHDYTGDSADEAVQALQDAGFRVDVSEQYSDTVDAGGVISQTPDDGTGFKHDHIKIIKSLGPELVTVPNVKSMGVEAATKTLKDKGFKVRVTKSGVLYLGLGYVAASDPGGGSKARKGSTITISLV